MKGFVDIGASYDLIADRWLSDSFDQTNGIRQHKNALRFLKGGRRALNVGCGCSGRFNALLQGRGFLIDAVDISAKMIAFAREEQTAVRFFHADVCTWNIPEAYDFISAWDCLWHVPLVEQAGVFERLCLALNAGGVFLFSMGGLDYEEEKSDAAMGPELYYATLGIPKTLELIERFGCVCRHLEYDQHPETHTYFIIQKR